MWRFVPLGALLGRPPRPSWEPPGLPWGPLGPSGRPLERVGAVLGPSGRPLERLGRRRERLAAVGHSI
eukprot:1139041-Pyramimonas_sp.AAC.1